MRHRHGTTITILRAFEGLDDFNNPIAGPTPPTVVEGCAVAPRMSTEPTIRGRHGVIVGLTLYAPPGTVILPTDRITIGGNDYQVEGEPGVWKNPFSGSTPGIEVALKRAEG